MVVYYILPFPSQNQICASTINEINCCNLCATVMIMTPQLYIFIRWIRFVEELIRSTDFIGSGKVYCRPNPLYFAKRSSHMTWALYQINRRRLQKRRIFFIGYNVLCDIFYVFASIQCGEQRRGGVGERMGLERFGMSEQFEMCGR